MVTKPLFCKRYLILSLQQWLFSASPHHHFGIFCLWSKIYRVSFIKLLIHDCSHPLSFTGMKEELCNCEWDLWPSLGQMKGWGSPSLGLCLDVKSWSSSKICWYTSVTLRVLSQILLSVTCVHLLSILSSRGRSSGHWEVDLACISPGNSCKVVWEAPSD